MKTKNNKEQRINNAQSNQVKPVQKKENKTGLPDPLKTGIEMLSGYDMSDVNVKYNSPEPEKVNAHAFAQGSDIHIANGQEKHLSHEAWHVAQQKQGKVKPTQTIEGVAVNDNPALENEATQMGKRAENATAQLARFTLSNNTDASTQTAQLKRFKPIMQQSEKEGKEEEEDELMQGKFKQVMQQAAVDPRKQHEMRQRTEKLKHELAPMGILKGYPQFGITPQRIETLMTDTEADRGKFLENLFLMFPDVKAIDPALRKLPEFAAYQKTLQGDPGIKGLEKEMQQVLQMGIPRFYGELKPPRLARLLQSVGSDEAKFVDMYAKLIPGPQYFPMKYKDKIKDYMQYWGQGKSREPLQ